MISNVLTYNVNGLPLTQARSFAGRFMKDRAAIWVITETHVDKSEKEQLAKALLRIRGLGYACSCWDRSRDVTRTGKEGNRKKGVLVMWKKGELEVRKVVDWDAGRHMQVDFGVKGKPGTVLRLQAVYAPAVRGERRGWWNTLTTRLGNAEHELLVGDFNWAPSREHVSGKWKDQGMRDEWQGWMLRAGWCEPLCSGYTFTPSVKVFGLVAGSLHPKVQWESPVLLQSSCQ